MKKATASQSAYARKIHRPDFWSYDVAYQNTVEDYKGFMGGGGSNETEATANFERDCKYYTDMGYTLTGETKAPIALCGTCYGNGFLRKPLSRHCGGPEFMCPFCKGTGKPISQLSTVTA